MSTSFNQWVIDEFRANGGRVGGPFEGSDLLLLTTTGATSGEPRTVPLGYVRHRRGLLVVGSNSGAPRHPHWYGNLLAHPLVRVETGTTEYEAVAVPAEGSDRDQLFAQLTRTAPGHAEDQRNTDRRLPVVVLERSDPAAGEGPREIRNLADKLLEVHRWLRGQLRHVDAEVAAYVTAHAGGDGTTGPATPPGLGLQIRQHCLAFCQTLEFHHTGEDTHMFPALEHSHPHLAEVFQRLRAEHRVVARLQRDLAALLGDISRADPAAFRSELARMAGELSAHLDYEEEQLIPALAEIPFPPVPPA